MPINDGPLLRHSAQVTAARQMTMGRKAQGLQGVRLHPGEISLWTSKACNKNWCCILQLWDPGIVPLQVTYRDCRLSHHLNISGRNATVLGKRGWWMIRHPFGRPSKVCLGWTALGLGLYLSVFSWLRSEGCVGTARAESTVSSVILYVDTNLLIRTFAVIMGTLCLCTLVFLFMLMH